MIVVSAGLEKSGTAWFFNLTNDVLQLGGGSDAREIRGRYRLESLLNSNCNIGPMTPRNFARLWAPVIARETFAVKTHYAPGHVVRVLSAVGLVRACFIFRDPRDIVVSILDHGEALRREGKSEVEFFHIHTAQQAAHFVASRMGVWDGWTRLPGRFVMRYEGLVGDPLRSARSLAEFLGVPASDHDLQDILACYAGGRARVDESLHFNVGVVGRYREALGSSDRAWCEDFLAPLVRRMGYR